MEESMEIALKRLLDDLAVTVLEDELACDCYLSFCGDEASEFQQFVHSHFMFLRLLGRQYDYAKVYHK